VFCSADKKRQEKLPGLGGPLCLCGLVTIAEEGPISGAAMLGLNSLLFWWADRLGAMIPNGLHFEPKEQVLSRLLHFDETIRKIAIGWI